MRLIVGTVQIIVYHMLGGRQLVSTVQKQIGRLFESIRVVPAGPYLEAPHRGAQTGLVEHLHFLGLGIARDRRVIGIDVVAVSVPVEKIPVGLAIGTDSRAYGRRLSQHAHGISGR